MRKAHLARIRSPSSSNQSGRGHGMVRRPKRRMTEEPAAWRKSPRNRVDRADLDRFLRGERRQNPGEALREHGLPRSRRPHEEEIVPAGRRDLERAPRDELTADIAEIRERSGRGLGARWARGGRERHGDTGWLRAVLFPAPKLGKRGDRLRRDN